MPKKAVIKYTILAIVLVFLISGAVFFLYAAVAKTSESPQNFLVLGDSIASGYGVEENEIYGKQVANNFGFIYQNYAAEGYDTQDLLAQMDLKEVRSAVRDADIIELSIGGNNALNLPYADMFSAAITGVDGNVIQDMVTEIETDLQTVLQQIRTLNPDGILLIQTLYNPFHGSSNPIYQVAENIMDELAPLINQKYEECAAQDDNTYIADVYTAFEQQDNPSLLIVGDRVHPTAAGHALIADVLTESLIDLGFEPRSANT